MWITGLIALINQTVGTMEMLTCISRPRRFGKSYAAKMLCAYYDCSCDSRELFGDKEIARTEGYLTHLNQYNVINLDITGFISDEARMDIPLSNVPNMIDDAVYRELTESYPELDGKSLTDAMIGCVEKSGKGIADVVYLPKRKSILPALIIELKWNKTSEGAIDQIKTRNYPTVLEDYGGEIVMAGINYDAKTKEHDCVIERV